MSGTATTAAALKAYLDWQSEMGTDEVILPHPLIRKQPTVSNAETPARSAAHSGAGSRSEDRGMPGNGPQDRNAGMDPISVPAGSMASGSPVAPSGREPGETAPPGLFESLAKALEQAAGPKQTGFGPSSHTRPPSGRAGETDLLPAFLSLADFWVYMDGHPQVLLGESPSTASPAGIGSVARAVHGVGPEKVALALVGFEPSKADEAAGKAFQGEAGALLEKMMRAIRLETRDLYLGNLIKACVAGKAWSRRELARLVPLLHLELGLVQAPMVLLLGQECAQAVLKTGKTLDELRQETHRMEGREFFVTYHPQELLRKEELKRKAWEDLQWVQRRMAEAQARP